jgi:hypothetical protein
MSYLLWYIQSKTGHLVSQLWSSKCNLTRPKILSAFSTLHLTIVAVHSVPAIHKSFSSTIYFTNSYTFPAYEITITLASNIHSHCFYQKMNTFLFSELLNLIVISDNEPFLSVFNLLKIFCPATDKHCKLLFCVFSTYYYLSVRMNSFL